jgi:hypothetical protein
VKLTLQLPGQRRLLGEILVEQSFITEEDLKAALASQRLEQTKVRIGTLLMDRGLISREQFMSALAQQLPVVKPYGMGGKH